jgi:hypothetical protein
MYGKCSGEDMKKYLPQFETANESFSIFKQFQVNLNLNEPELDSILHQALNGHGIIEIFGPSAAGKSTLAIQLAISFLVENPGCRVIYFYSHNQYCVRRCNQIIESRYNSIISSDEINHVLSRLILINLPDFDRQCFYLSTDFLKKFSSAACPIRLIIVDTISNHIRSLPRSNLVTHKLYAMASALNDFCYEEVAHVLCINEVSAAFDSFSYVETDSFKDRSQSKYITVEDKSFAISKGSENPKSHNESIHKYDDVVRNYCFTLPNFESKFMPFQNMVGDDYKPSMGLSWSNCISTRIELCRSSKNAAGDHITSERLIIVHRSPSCAPKTISCRLSNKGIEFSGAN